MIEPKVEMGIGTHDKDQSGIMAGHATKYCFARVSITRADGSEWHDRVVTNVHGHDLFAAMPLLSSWVRASVSMKFGRMPENETTD